MRRLFWVVALIGVGVVALLFVRLKEVGTLSAGFTPRKMPSSDACRFPLTLVSKWAFSGYMFIR